MRGKLDTQGKERDASALKNEGHISVTTQEM
jgi:hypothetical protein